MTPRQADLALLLESAEGVLDMYAIDPAQRVAEHFDFAVRIAPGGRAIAVVHYALLQILTHAECTRVFVCKEALPAVVAAAARPLVLDGPERVEARQRAAARPSPEPIQEIGSKVLLRSMLLVLVVDDDPQVEANVEAVIADPVLAFAVDSVEGALTAAARREPDLVLCAARFAFGKDGLLARLPLRLASKVLVLAHPSEIVDACWRLQGSERILRKPLEGWILRNRIDNARSTSKLSAPDRERVIGSPPPAERRLTTPHPSAPFSALLVDLDDDIHEQLRWCFRGEARHVMRRDPEQAAALALSTPFHLVAISANAALHPPRSFLDAVGRVSDADGVLIFAPTRDVPYVKHELAARGRKSLVLPIPIDDTTLRREIFRKHPALAARLAVEEMLESAQNAPPQSAEPRFRRRAVLVVDDDPTTAILFAARTASDHGADVSFVATPMGAFEHVVERPVDLLLVSATMRGDSGEPFYRVLWRLAPALKRRSVLVTSAAARAGAPPSSSRHVVERPLTRDVVARIVHAFALDDDDPG